MDGSVGERERLGRRELSRDVQATGGVFENRLRLVSTYPWEPIEELLQPGAGFEVLEKRLDGDPGAWKTQAPLTLSGERVTSGQADQSSMGVRLARDCSLAQWSPGRQPKSRTSRPCPAGGIFRRSSTASGSGN